METTKLGTEEQERFTLRPSARSTIRFPLKNKNKVIKVPPCAQLIIPWPYDVVHLGAHLLPHQLLGLQAEHIDLGVTMAHVAHDTAILHLVHVVARDHVLVAGRSDHDVDPLDDFS